VDGNQVGGLLTGVHTTTDRLRLDQEVAHFLG
jgi:hypothetical protein